MRPQIIANRIHLRKRVNTATASALLIVTLMNPYKSLLEQHIRETIFNKGFRIQKYTQSSGNILEIAAGLNEGRP